MRNVLGIVVLAGMLGLLSNPAPADAEDLDTCMQESIKSCDKDFPGGGLYSSSIRGWCYIIRTGMCALE